MHFTTIGAVTCGMSLSGPIFTSCTAEWEAFGRSERFRAQRLLGLLVVLQQGQRRILALAIRQRAHGGYEPLQPFGCAPWTPGPPLRGTVAGGENP